MVALSLFCRVVASGRMITMNSVRTPPSEYIGYSLPQQKTKILVATVKTKSGWRLQLLDPSFRLKYSHPRVDQVVVVHSSPLDIRVEQLPLHFSKILVVPGSSIPIASLKLHFTTFDSTFFPVPKDH